MNKINCKGMQKARETLKKMGYLENEVLIYFVEDIEISDVMRKIKKFLGDDVNYEHNPSKMALKVIFRDREKAEWCMKMLRNNFIINGKRLTLKWIKDKPKPKRNIKGQILNEDGTIKELSDEDKSKNEKKKEKVLDGETIKKEVHLKNKVRGTLKLDRISKVTLIPSELKNQRELTPSGFDFNDFMPRKLPKTMNELQRDKAKKVFLDALDQVHGYNQLNK